jgi:catechol 2,3-dioxygenase-like lactoylglutathione lyase family enzyme
MKPHLVLRVARPTNDLAAVVRFYRDGLGLQELFRFDDHDGFDGVMPMATMRAGHPPPTIWLSSTCRTVMPGKGP